MTTYHRAVFVFGSNLAGRHGKGAAQTARIRYGAKQGVSVGPQGNAYAIPTKDKHLRSLDLPTIRQYVADFLRYARAHPNVRFNLTAIGTGLAAHKVDDIRPMFAEAPSNVFKPVAFGGTWDAEYQKDQRDAGDVGLDENRSGTAQAPGPDHAGAVAGTTGRTGQASG